MQQNTYLKTTIRFVKKSDAVPSKKKEDFFTVVDQSRPHMPIIYCDVKVPFFPFVENMVKIRGNRGNWFGKILSVDEGRKTVRVCYHHYTNVVTLVATRAELVDTVLWDNLDGNVSNPAYVPKAVSL